MVFKGKNVLLRLTITKGNIKPTLYTGNSKESQTLVDAVLRGKKFFIQARMNGREFEITKVGL